jgi:hypothetical protein
MWFDPIPRSGQNAGVLGCSIDGKIMSEGPMKRIGMALLISGTVWAHVHAHHSFAASYLEDQSVTVEGEVVEFQFRNPHSLVLLNVQDQVGTVQTFVAEWASGTRLQLQGLTADSLQPGDHLVITGAPGRTADEHRVHLKQVIRPSDGWSWAGFGRRGSPGGFRRFDQR